MTVEEQDEKEFEEWWNKENPPLIDARWLALKSCCLKWWLASRRTLRVKEGA